MRARLVVGFMFCGAHVLLVNKQKPKWQEGLWNGIGGKVERDESPMYAMPREFREETCIDTAQDNWTHFATETGPEYELFCYRARLLTFGLLPVPKINDAGEPLRWVNVDTLYGYRKIGNLNWLIPLAQDWRKGSVVQFCFHDDIREKASW
jgi:8-oxo-dGTP diphosphatase